MKRSRITAVATVLGLIVASCGGSSDSAPRQRNMAPATNVSLKPCVLGPRVNCEGAFLSKVNAKALSRDWSGANLSGLTWDGANFNSVVMTNTNLSSARLSRVNARYVSAVGASFVNAKIHTLEGPVFNNRFREIDGTGDFSKADFSYAELWNVSFAGAKLNDAKFFGADLVNVDFTSANLTGVDLSSSHLSGITGVNIVGTPKLPTGWKIVNKNLVGPSAILRTYVTADFLNGVSAPEQKATSPYAYGRNKSACQRPTDSRMNSFTPVSFGRNSFSGVALKNIDFSGVNLVGVSFDGLTLENVNFSAARFIGATFKNTTLKNVDLSYADLGSTNFSSTKMSGVVSQCTFTSSSSKPVFPAGWRLITEDTQLGFSEKGRLSYFNVARGVLIGPGSDLTGKNLIGIDLSNIDLSTAILSKVKSGNIMTTTFSGGFAKIGSNAQTKLPNGFGIRGGVLVGPEVDLSYAELRNLDLTGLSLEGANLEGVVSQNIRGDVRLDEDARIVNGYLVARGVNLSKVRLGSGDLTGVDLRDSNLLEADLSGVTLDGVRSNGVIGAPILPKNWVIAGGVIFGPTADLSESVFDPKLTQRFSLDKVDLSQAKLEGSNIVGFLGTPKVPKGWIVVKAPSFMSDANALVGSRSFMTSNVAENFPPTAQLPAGYVRLGRSIFGPHLHRTSAKGLVGGEIDGVDFSDSMLMDVDFSQTVIRSAKGERINVRAESPVRWPSGWAVLNEILVGPAADLSQQHLVEMDLSGIDLSNAKLAMVNGRGLSFDQRTKLPMGWGIINGVLMGPEADLSNTYIAGANLNGIDLSNADLSNAIMKRISGSPLLPEGYQIVRGTLVGEGVDIVCSDVLPKDLQDSSIPNARVSAMYSPEKFGLKKATVQACL